MSLVRPGEFERALRALDRDALAAFVADLWAAGGWETGVEGPLVVAERSGRRRRIGVVAAGRGLDRLRRRAPALGDPDLRDLDLADHGADDPGDADDPDVVVDASGSGRVAAAARAAEAEYVPPAALRDRLLYGVPRDTAADLSWRHLDRSLERIQNRSATDPLVGPTALLLGAVVAVLVVGMVAAGPLGLLTAGPEPSTGATGADQSDADGGAATAATAGAAAGTSTGATAGTPERTAARETLSVPSVPPGLSTSGVEDVAALADAHVAATRTRRYAVNVSFEGPAAATGFRDFESVAWSMAVEGRQNFRIDGRFRRANDTDQPWIRVGVYANGFNMYRRLATPNGTRYEVAPAATRDGRAYPDTTSTLIVRYLDTTTSTVRLTETADGPRFRVIATGTPEQLDESVVDYRAEALVTPRGRVTMLAVRYTIAGDGGERDVRVRVDYGEFGTTRVSPPDWYGEARNETSRFG